MFYTSIDNHNSKIYVRGYDDEGKRLQFVLGQDTSTKEINLSNSFHITESDYKKFAHEIDGYLSYLVDTKNIKYYDIMPDTVNKNIYGENLYRLQFNYPDTYSVRDCFQKHIPECKLLGDIDLKYKVISGYTDRKNFKVESNQIKIGYIDIECEAENGYAGIENPTERINAISIRIQNDKMYLWCLGKYTNNNPDIYSFCFENEAALLKHFLQKWRELDLDVISGWNINRFDIPYIIRRADLINISAKSLSPYNIIKEKKVSGKFGGEDITYNILGIQLLDYMELYQKHIYEPRSSYSLNNITNIELGEGKLDYSEYGNLHSLYKNNFQKFIDYNIRDTDLVLKLEEKLKLISLVIHISYMAGVNYEDIASPVRTWDAIIYNELKKDNIIIKENKQNESSSYPGAYVKKPTAGIYNWVASFDVNSLYPNLIRQINISPETIIDEEYTNFFKDSNETLEEDEYRLESLYNTHHNLEFLKEKSLSLAASGNLYKKDKSGFLPTIIGRMYNDRVKAKTEMKKYKKLYEEAKKELSSRNL